MNVTKDRKTKESRSALQDRWFSLEAGVPVVCELTVHRCTGFLVLPDHDIPPHSRDLRNSLTASILIIARTDLLQEKTLYFSHAFIVLVPACCRPVLARNLIHEKILIGSNSLPDHMMQAHFQFRTSQMIKRNVFMSSFAEAIESKSERKKIDDKITQSE